MIVRTEEILFEFDGETYNGFAGESIAAALLRVGVTHLRDAPNSQTPRGMFCVMGVCQEGVVEINQRRVEACRTKVSNGLKIKRASNV